MPFYFRDSISAGPFRFNFSKGGVGVSVGVRGFRIGTGPRGHYVHAGRGGLNYRASLVGSPTVDRRDSPSERSAPARSPSRSEPGVTMIAVSSGDVLDMVDARFADLLGELNEKQTSATMAAMLAFLGAVASLPAFGFFQLAGGFLALAIGVAAGSWIGSWWDSYRRSAVVFYELDDEAGDAYKKLVATFDGLAACQGKWRIDSGGAINDVHTWKRNAGASQIVDRRPTTFAYALPRVLNSNVTPPSIGVGKETLYLLPDVVLVVEANKIGAIAYDALRIRWEDSIFIEEGSVPSDAEVISQTWKHPNKNGGPDRRFANNHQIPVCRYEAMHLTSDNGLNELVQVSRTGLSAPFWDAVQSVTWVLGNASRTLDLPKLS